MIYTVQVHENQEKQFTNQMEDSDMFKIIEEIAFGAFQVKGPQNSLYELRSLESIYAINRDSPIQFGVKNSDN